MFITGTQKHSSWSSFITLLPPNLIKILPRGLKLIDHKDKSHISPPPGKHVYRILFGILGVTSTGIKMHIITYSAFVVQLTDHDASAPSYDQ